MLNRVFFITLILIFLLFPYAVKAQPSLPARIGGTVTVDGVLLTQSSDSGYTFAVTSKNGVAYSPAAEDGDGLNAAGYYLIDIPVYDKASQPGGANPGDKAIIHIYKDSAELPVKSPNNGEFTIGKGGTTSQINLEVISNTVSVKPDGDVAPLGDRDGTINVGDALVALRFALSLDTPSQQDIAHGDVAPLDTHGKPNPDGKFTVGDALVILRKALGIIAF
jgi:hypothetical protein